MMRTDYPNVLGRSLVGIPMWVTMGQLWAEWHQEHTSAPPPPPDASTPRPRKPRRRKPGRRGL